MSTSIEAEIVPKFRRAIGDNEEPYSYADILLAEYLADSLEALSLDWNHGYEVDRDMLVIEPEVDVAMQYLIMLKARVDLMQNRPNVNFTAGTMSVRRDTSDIDNIQKDLSKALRKVKTLQSLGISTTEYDRYKDRVEDWFKYILY